MHKHHPLRAAVAVALTVSAGLASAHTGHGHDGLSLMQGLRHALGEPDHLLMGAFGFGICSLLAPRVVRGLQRLGRHLQQRRRVREAP
jgi:hydrogenase/urease accessory protein HupE